MNLHLYEYNNYYNRTLKSFNSIEELDDYELFVEYNTNFNPNDSVFTEHIIGGPLAYYGGADYCVVERDGEIESRWFVLENMRTRGGQYKISLKRDVVADFATDIFNAPCFVEKGWVNDTDSAIFNSENMTFNQIKKREIRLTDSTRTPWIVGYYTKQDEPLTATIEKIEPTADITVNGIANWTYYNRTLTPAKYASTYGMTFYFNASDLPAGNSARVKYGGLSNNDIALEEATIVIDNITGRQYTIDTDSALWSPFLSSIDPNVVNKLTEELKSASGTLFAAATNYFSDYLTSTEYTAVSDNVGLTIFDSATGIYYKVEAKEKIASNPGVSAKIELTSTMGYELYNVFSQVSTPTGGISGARPTKNSDKQELSLKVENYAEIYLELKQLDYGAVDVSILPTAPAQTINSPYNIFAIPYGRIRVVDNGANVYTSQMLAMRTAMALIKQYSGTVGILHDVQLLPYCPIQEIREAARGGTSPLLQIDTIPDYLYTRMTDEEDNTVGYVFHCPNSSATFNIKQLIEIPNIKISNETEFCRLVSPNWNGMFEFSPAKNRGVEGFTVDMELKPFSPYIHVAPKWNENGLYGNRPNDPVGLICGGDFGLTMTSDAWENYERQNKNYQQMFDRQIQNLEVQNKYGRLADTLGGAIGAVSGGATVGIAGGMIGGPAAGIGAGIIGAGLSGAGAIGDYFINEALRKENMDYTKDQFGYQLGNIRALPDSLTKVNSLNPNNRIFPILEFYGATNEEVEALRNKIKYNGMSIGRIGKLADFINPAETTYVKGQIIILEGILEDAHLAADIATEINKGVRV